MTPAPPPPRCCAPAVLRRAAPLLAVLALCGTGCGDDSQDNKERAAEPRLALKAVRSAVPDAPNALQQDGCVIRGADSDRSFFVEVDVSNFELRAPGGCRTATACGSVAVQLRALSGELLQHTLGITEQFMVPTRALSEDDYVLRVLLVQSFDTSAEYLIDGRQKARCTDCEQRITIAARCGDLGPIEPPPPDAGTPPGKPRDAGPTPTPDAALPAPEAGPLVDAAADAAAGISDAGAADVGGDGGAAGAPAQGPAPTAGAGGASADASAVTVGDAAAGAVSADDAASTSGGAVSGVVMEAGTEHDAGMEAGTDAGADAASDAALAIADGG